MTFQVAPKGSLTDHPKLKCHLKLAVKRGEVNPFEKTHVAYFSGNMKCERTLPLSQNKLFDEKNRQIFIYSVDLAPPIILCLRVFKIDLHFDRTPRYCKDVV